MEGWIKLHRKLLDWEWISKPEMVSLFLYLLLNANYDEKKWQGVIIKKGQIITGRFELSKKLGISERSIRTCIDRLVSTNEISIKTTNKFSIVTISKYEDYQINGNDNDQQTTNKRPTNDQQTTTPKESKKEKNEKNNIFVIPNLDEIKIYCKEKNSNLDAEIFFYFYESKGWMVGKNKMKNWKACIATWEKNNKQKQTVVSTKQPIGAR